MRGPRRTIYFKVDVPLERLIRRQTTLLVTIELINGCPGQQSPELRGFQGLKASMTVNHTSRRRLSTNGDA